MEEHSRVRHRSIEEYTDIGGNDPFTINELRMGLKKANNRKAPGPDQVLMEVIKKLKIDNLYIFINMFNSLLVRGKFPKDGLSRQ